MSEWSFGQPQEGNEPQVAVWCKCGEWTRVTCGKGLFACSCGRQFEAKVILRVVEADDHE